MCLWFSLVACRKNNPEFLSKHKGYVLDFAAPTPTPAIVVMENTGGAQRTHEQQAAGPVQLPGVYGKRSAANSRGMHVCAPSAQHEQVVIHTHRSESVVDGVDRPRQTNHRCSSSRSHAA